MWTTSTNSARWSGGSHATLGERTDENHSDQVKHASPRILVLGASSSIGQAVCRRFLADGAHVTGQYWNSGEALWPLACPAFDAVRWDLADLPQARILASAFTDVDVVISLASLTTPTSLADVSANVLSASLNVGALSPLLIIGEIGPHMAERGWGRIVVGSSIGVRFGGGVDSFAYALANHAKEFLPASVRGWSRWGVLANIVRIGVTRTAAHDRFPERRLVEREGKIPMGRAAEPDEIASFICWLGSDRNTYLTGQVIAHSGGE